MANMFPNTGTPLITPVFILVHNIYFRGDSWSKIVAKDRLLHFCVHITNKHIIPRVKNNKIPRSLLVAVQPLN